jgi:hypothetical protein
VFSDFEVAVSVESDRRYQGFSEKAFLGLLFLSSLFDGVCCIIAVNWAVLLPSIQTNGQVYFLL